MIPSFVVFTLLVSIVIFVVRICRLIDCDHGYSAENQIAAGVLYSVMIILLSAILGAHIISII